MGDGSSEPVTSEAWEQALAAEFRAFMEQTRAAMNAGRAGHWIADPQEVVRDAGELLRQRALEKLLPLRVQAGEGAFSPSGPRAGWQDEGRRPVEHLTAVGHVRVLRRVGWKKGAGAPAPGDEWLNGGGPRIRVGVRELCSRIGQPPQGFRESAEALRGWAGLTVSPERLRPIVEGEGRRMAAARAEGQVEPSWQADACRVRPEGPSRVYVGVEGVLVPILACVGTRPTPRPCGPTAAWQIPRSGPHTGAPKAPSGISHTHGPRFGTCV
jgi:hypothetical protein